MCRRDGHHGRVPAEGARPPSASPSSELLGFPVDARVLIINCDDLGMHQLVNAAVLEAVEQGVATSCSLIVPAPAAAQALQMLSHSPAVPFGVHLTLTRDAPALGWTPISGAGQVPSLVGEDGLLLTAPCAPQLMAQARIEDVEHELRAQIDTVMRTGLQPTHLDWHALADGGRPDILDVTLDLAREYEVAARVWLEAGRRAARTRGLPVVDHDFLDSFALDGTGKERRFVRLIQALPAGLTEWAVHPAADDGTTDDVDLGWAVRRSDRDFLLSPVARRVLDDEGIELIDYRPLQRAWSAEADRRGRWRARTA